jgi:PhnB protein
MTSPAAYPPITPYLAVHDGARAIEFYQRAFGATELYRLTDPADGKVGHAELLINQQLVMLADEYVGYSNTPRSLGGTSVRMVVMVADVDAATAQCQGAGAVVLQPPTDHFYGFRSATVQDPFGHEWMLQHEIEKLTPAEMQRRWNAMLES